MAAVTPVVASLVFLGLVLPAHALPAVRLARVTSGEARGFPNMAAGSEEVRSPVKRELSIDQVQRSLANMLNANEYYRIRSNNMNRAFLRKIGKRANTNPSDSDSEGLEVDGGVLHLPLWEPAEEPWSRW